MTGWGWTSGRIADAIGTPGMGGVAGAYTGVSTDTRTLQPGQLFVALRGPHFDATDFLGAAAGAGARGAVVERRPQEVPESLELFEVRDTLQALGQLAAARRRQALASVIAITGTSGKTTTRELTAAVLGEAAYASPANYNNLVGLPLSILAAPLDASAWVLEVASNQPGEVRRLGRIARPEQAVITSVSEGHLEGLGDLAGVLKEKLALLETLRPKGRAYVADGPEELVRGARRRCADLVTVGLSGAADVRPERWSMGLEGMAWRWEGTEFALPGYGSHLVRNALFALAVGRQLGVDPRTASRRLGEVRLPPMRGELRRFGDLTLLVDCYNANPASFEAALESLSALARGRRRAVLAGSMLELGERSDALHEEVAERMLEQGIELVAATGEFAAAFGRISGRPRDGLVVAADVEGAYRGLAARLKGDEVVLLKASRGMRFEQAIPLFERDFGNQGRVRASGA